MNKVPSTTISALFCLVFIYASINPSYAQKLSFELAQKSRLDNPVYSPDGKHFAFSSQYANETKTSIINAQTGEVIQSKKWASPLFFGEKSKRLFFLSGSRQICFLNIDDGSYECLTKKGNIFHEGFIKKDNSILYCAYKKNLIGVYNLDSLKFIHTIKTKLSNINSIDVNPQKRILILTETKGDIHIYDLDSYEKINTISNINTYLGNTSYHADSNTLAFIDQKSLKIYSLNEGKIKHKIEGDFRLNTPILFYPNGKYFITKNGNNICTYSTRTGGKRNALPLYCMNKMAISPSGKFLIAHCGNELKLIDLELERNLLNYFMIGDNSVIYTPEGLLETNDLGLEYAKWTNKSGTKVGVAKNSKNYVPKLYEKVLKDETEELIKELGVEMPPIRSKINREGKDHALLVAVQDYEHWENLKSPIKDLEAIKEVLKDVYNFEVKTLINPSKAQLREAIDSYREENYVEDEQLFIFLSGHGDFREKTKEGYFVTKNSKIPKDDKYRDTYLSFHELKAEISGINCEHILIAIDACYSGTFDESIASKGEERGKRPGEEEQYSDNFVKAVLKRTSKLYLSSGGKEKTPDAIGHTPFVEKLLKALDDEGGEDGILTFNELLQYMEQAKPKPRHGTFGNSESNDAFLFIRQ